MHSKNWGGKPVLGLSPLSAHKQNKEIPSIAVLALFIETIDGIMYFAIKLYVVTSDDLSDIL